MIPNKETLKRLYTKKEAAKIIDRAADKVLDREQVRIVSALREIFNYKPDVTYSVKSI